MVKEKLEIFAFNQTGVKKDGEVIGEFVKNNVTPEIYKRIKSRGITNLADMFE